MNTPPITRDWPEIVRRAHAIGKARPLAFVALMEEHPNATGTEYALAMGCSRRNVELIARSLGVSLKYRPVILRTILLAKVERDALFMAATALLSGIPCTPDLSQRLGTQLAALHERSAQVAA